MFDEIRIKAMDRMEFYADKMADIGFGRLPFVSRIYREIRNIFIDNTWADLAGYEILVDPKEFVGRRIYENNFHEEELKNKILEEVDEGDTVVDIGGHIGSTALIFRKAVNDSGKVMVYEPDPVNFTLLSKTIDRNSFENISIREKALSDESGTARLVHQGNNTGESFLSGKNSKQGYTVDKAPAEEILQWQNHIDYIKLDIEGGEYEVIKNLEEHLGQIDNIFLELHPSRISYDKIEEIYNILDKKGSLEDLSGQRLDLEDIERIIEDEENKNENILWRR